MTNGRWRSSLAAALALTLALSAPLPAGAAHDLDSGTLTDTFDVLGQQWHQSAGQWEARDGAARVVTAGTPRGSVLALAGHRLQPASSARVTFRTEGGSASAWAGITVDRADISDDYTESGYTVLVRNSGEVAVIAAAGSSAVRYLGTAATDARPGVAPVTLTADLDGADLVVSLGVEPTEVLRVSDDAFDEGGFTLAAHRDLSMVVEEVALTGVEHREETAPVPADCKTWSGTPAVSAERGAVLNSEERVEAITRRVDRGVEPQASAFDRLIEEAAADMQRSPAPPTTFFVPFFYNNPAAHRAARDGLQNDANAAYRLALAYRITGDSTYGEHATSFVDAWTETVECVRTSEDSALAFSYHFPAFIHAAELLAGTPVWTAHGEAAFAGFVGETAVPVAGSILHRNNNWGSWALETTAAAAGYLNDASLIEASHDRAMELLEHQLDENGHMPEEVNRNNGVGDYGIWYTHFSLLPLMLVSETLSAHGYDLHSYVNANGVGLSDAVEAVSGWVAEPSSFEYFTGDIDDLANVRTIDYLRDTGVIAHSMSYFELAANHYPSVVLDTLLAQEGAMTTIHSAPFLSLTHGSMLSPDPDPIVSMTVGVDCAGPRLKVVVDATNISDDTLDIAVDGGVREQRVEDVHVGERVRAVFVMSVDDATGSVSVRGESHDGPAQTAAASYDVLECSVR